MGTKLEQDVLETRLRLFAQQESVRVAIVCTPHPELEGHALVRALVRDGVLEEPGTYPLAGTPCERIYRRGVAYHSHRVAELYPDDLVLAEWGVESYLGVVIPSRDGQVVGHVGVLSDGPFPDPAGLERRLRSIAREIAAIVRS